MTSPLPVLTEQDRQDRTGLFSGLGTMDGPAASSVGKDGGLTDCSHQPCVARAVHITCWATLAGSRISIGILQAWSRVDVASHVPGPSRTKGEAGDTDNT